VKRTLLLNATILNQPELIGLGVYAVSMFRELLSQPVVDWPYDRVALTGRPSRLEELLGDIVKRSGAGIIDLSTERPVNRLVLLNRLVRRERRGGEVYFYSPTHHGVIVHTSGQVVTVPDLFPLLFPRNYRQQYYYYRYYLPRLLRRSSMVITLSDHTARDLARFFPSVAHRKTIYAGLRHDLADVTPDPVKPLVSKPFFLFVGPSYRHKNADRLISAFAAHAGDDRLSQYQLVFAGGRRDYLHYLQGVTESLATEVAARVHFLGYVSRAELAWLYRQATATMVTSLYEGFGLPALEAMSFSCPVVASKVASLPEVCGDAAWFVDPDNVGEIAEAMKRLVYDDSLRSRLAEKGAENLGRFSWQQAADQVRTILRQLVPGESENSG